MTAREEIRERAAAAAEHIDNVQRLLRESWAQLEDVQNECRHPAEESIPGRYGTRQRCPDCGLVWVKVG